MAGDTLEFCCTATTCDQQWLYRIGDDGLVYSQKQNRFAGLDAAGVSAYQAFDAGAQPQDLHAFRDTEGTASETAQALVTLHALAQGRFPGDTGHNEQILWPVLASPRSANVLVHNIPVFFQSPDEAVDILCRDCFSSCPPASEPARFHLRGRNGGASQTKKSWTLSINDRELFSSVQAEQVGLGMLHGVRSLLYDEAEYDVAFHAAMVSDGEHGIILCAPRESGKSTLAAYLVARGFDLVSDEPALLHLETASIPPLEMPISLKEGSWEILEHEWPQLSASPIHVRSDGCRIRLLHPPPDRLASSPKRLTHIVFPKYSPSSQARIEGLTPFRALTLLDEGGMLLGKNLSKDKFEVLLKLLCTTPALIANYRSLQEAEHLFGRILSEPASHSRLYI